MASGDRSHNKLILTLKKAIESLFDQDNWKELGYSTDSIDWINGHSRLLRSLSCGDSDYGSYVFDAIEYILAESPTNLEVLLEFEGIEEWIHKNAPSIHRDYYGGIVPSVENIGDVEKEARGFDV